MQTLNLTLENLPKDRNGKISKDYLRVALDLVSPSAGLPPVGAIEEVYSQMHAEKVILFPTYFGFIYLSIAFTLLNYVCC